MTFRHVKINVLVVWAELGLHVPSIVSCRTSALSSLNSGVGLGSTNPKRESVSEDEAAIQSIPRSRFGLVSEPPTLFLKLDAALAWIPMAAVELRISYEKP